MPCTQYFFNAKAVTQSRQSGFTLVEILVSLALTSIIATSVVQFYSSNHITEQLNNGLTHLQQNAQLALLLIEKDILLVNYQGCSDPYKNFINTSENSLQANSAPLTNLLLDGLQGFEITSANNTSWADGTNLTDIEGNVLIGSDVFSIMSASTTATTLSSSMAATNSSIAVGTNPNNLAEGELLLIASCSDATLFRASAVSTGNPVTISHVFGGASDENSSASFNSIYGTDAKIHKFSYNTYYVALNSANIPALHRRDVDGNVDELVEGIENIQVLYGQHDVNGTETDLSDDRIRFVSANDSSLNMQQVDRIQIALLVGSDTQILNEDTSDSFDLLGSQVAPYVSDKQMRRVFTTSIQLRNRKPYLME